MPDVKNCVEKKQGSAAFLSNGRLALGSWYDKKLVCLVSNHHQNQIVNHERWGKGKKKHLLIPLMLKDYNKFMKGVDRFDQKTAFYSYKHKTKTWWKYLFLYLLDMVYYNSFVILNFHQRKGKREIDYSAFLIKLAKALAKYEAIIEVPSAAEEE